MSRKEGLKKATMVRLDEALHEKFKALMEKDSRSVNNGIEMLVRQFVEREERKTA